MADDFLPHQKGRCKKLSTTVACGPILRFLIILESEEIKLLRPRAVKEVCCWEDGAPHGSLRASPNTILFFRQTIKHRPGYRRSNDITYCIRRFMELRLPIVQYLSGGPGLRTDRCGGPSKNSLANSALRQLTCLRRKIAEQQTPKDLARAAVPSSALKSHPIPASAIEEIHHFPWQPQFEL